MTDQAPGTPTSGAPGAPAPGAVAPAPSAPPPASPVPWLQGADDLTVGYVQNKGWDSPMKMLDSYRSLEKTFGADRAGHTVVLPKEGAAQADLDAFYNRLGRPATADGYKIDTGQPWADKEFAKAAASKFHELGLSQKQGDALAAWHNERIDEALKSQEEAKQLKFTEDDRALRQKWGAAFDQNLEQARAFVRGMDIDEATIDKLEDGMGHMKLMEFFQTLGAKMGEADFVSGQGQPRFGQALTPQQALAKIEDLRLDKEWVAKYLSGDAGAKDEMRRLQEFAHPGAL